MSDEIAALEARVEALRSDLRDTEKKLMAARIAASGITIGQIVRGSRDGKTYRVAGVRPEPYRKKPWLLGNPQRADGSFGTALRNLYDDWEMVGAKDAQQKEK